MSKNKQQIKFEADVQGFNSNIKSAENTIKNLNNQLKLNQAQLKGSENNTNLLGQKIETLKLKYEEQTKIVDNTRESLSKAKEIFGENSKEVDNLKNKLLQAETSQQNIKNAIDKASKQLEVQTSKLLINSKKWQESGERLKDYGSKIESVGNKLSIFSGIIAGVAVASAKSAIKFESAFAGVAKTVDGTEEELNDLREGILEMSTKLPSSATEIAGVAEAAGQLGIKTENVLGFSKAMIDLGNSTNLSASEAASQLAKFVNIMGTSQKDFDKLGSSIVDLGNNYATTEADIVSMAIRLAGASKQVGISEGETLGLATALSSVGIEAEMGGSAISKAMIKMQNAVELGGEKLNNVLKKSGKSLRTVELMAANDSKSFKSLSQSLGMTSTEFKNLITAGRNLEDFAKVSGMSAEQFKKAWKEDASGALSAFIKGLGDAENKGESAITMLSEMGLTEVRLRDSLLRAANAGDLFNNAIDTGSKAWKENTALANEANKRYETTESQLQMLKNEVQKTAIEFGDELSPSLRELVKDFKPTLKSISSAVKSFSELDDKTKQAILKIGTFAIVLGPLIKTGGKVITLLGTAKTGISTLTGAIGVLKNGAEGASASSISLANSMKSMAGPVGLVAAEIAIFAAGIAVAEANARKELETTRKLNEEMQNSVFSRQEAINAIDKQQQSNLSEMNHVQKLSNELRTLADENGKVKEGYESRAQFILNELNEALGTEYSLNGNIIKSYQEMKDEIDDLILKKKAQFTLEANEDKYKEAKKNKDGLYQENLKTRQELDEVVRKFNALKEDLKDTITQDTGESFFSATAKMKEYSKSIESLTQTLSEQEDQMKEYSNAISTYDTNSRLMIEGGVENYKKIEQSVAQSQSFITTTASDELHKRIKDQINANYKLKELYSLEARYNKDAKDSVYYTNVQEGQKNLGLLVQQLISQTSVVEENTPETIKAWKQLAIRSYSTYYDEVSKLPVDLQKKIEEMTGVPAEKTPKLEEETKKMASSIVDKLKNNSEFRAEAINNLQGYLNGLSDETLRETLKQAGVENVDKVMQGIREGNLAEGEGMNILEKLSNGLNNKTWKDNLFGVARGIASTLSGLLSVKANVNGNTSKLPGHKNGLDYVPYDNYVARLHKGERVLTAEENKEYMSGNIENKILNNNKSIVVQFYPQTMSESEMKKAENYIRKKWGTSI